MLQIRLTQPGWESYTGSLATINFVDGVSVSHASQIEVERISALIAVETIDGDDPGVLAKRERFIAGIPNPIVYDPEPVEPEAPVVVYDFTRESLMEVADKEGITGLRVIADKYGIKSNSVVGLIDKLMALTGEVKDQLTQEPVDESTIVKDIEV